MHCYEYITQYGSSPDGEELPVDPSQISDGTYGVILKIVKAGSHPVAIAQVVEHWQLKSEALVQSRVAASFSQFSKNIPKPFLMYNVACVLCSVAP